jgi:hypothetical protein
MTTLTPLWNPLPMIVIVVPPAIAPTPGVTELTARAVDVLAVYVKGCPALVVPSGLTTVTSTVPVPGGTGTLMNPESSQEMDAAGTPPKYTVLLGKNPLPRIVTL